MAREPHYPDEAPIGSATPSAGGSGSDGGAGDGSAGSKGARAGSAGAGGETAKAVAAARAASGGASGDPARRKHLVAGAAIGIGSAAIVAALLYANRRGKGDRD
jgi:hypothetical protein